MNNLLRSFALVAFAAGAMHAQNLTGTWQGTFPAAQNRPALRIVVKINRAPDESWKGTLYSIDQGGQAITLSTVSLQGTTFKMTSSAISLVYEGRLSADGDTISGTWAQGGGEGTALTFARATPSTEWTIPEPRPAPKPMPPDAKPTFEVSTVKPSPPDAQGRSILVGRGGGNLFTTTNTPLIDLIVMAYGVHARQITGAPSWVESERYDISAKPDQPGIPSVAQLTGMMQKLLEERFGLKIHRDKKELSCYVLSVAKSGPKMDKSEAAGNLPGFGGRGPGAIGVNNSTMSEFAGFLQSRIVDRPVVDQTALSGRFNFTLRWTPDGAPAADPPPADAPPDLFAAMQQQLGLKLESSKAPVEVIVIDSISKPTAN